MTKVLFFRKKGDPARSRMLILVSLACLLVLTGCSETLPAFGEVVLLLSTDMSVPDGFDTLVLERRSDKTRWLFTAGNVATELAGEASECGPSENPASSKLKFPTTIVLKSTTDEPFSADLELKACKNGRLVFARRFDVTLPEPGQQKMVRAPIRWLCTQWSTRCYGCVDTTKNGPQACHHQHIALLDGGGLCTTSACDQNSEKYFKTMEYMAAEVAAYSASSTASDGTCFDAATAFGIPPANASGIRPDSTTSQFVRTQAWFHVPTQWRKASDGSGEFTCEATVAPVPFDDGTGLDVRKLNLALVLPPDDLGFCDAQPCVVPLEALDPVGWALNSDEEWNDHGEKPLVLPAAVCHMLDSGQILYIIGSTVQAQKGFTTPYCTNISSSLAATNESPFSGIAYLWFSLDDQNAWSTPGQMTPSLQPSVGRLTGMSTEIAVSGRAGNFTNKAYGYAAMPLVSGQEFTLSAWISLTELLPTTPVAATKVMPILSDISNDCSGGARLELRTQADPSSVQLAIGVPTDSPPTDTGQCELAYTCAELAAQSYAGGYFTPWMKGTWYHVAATADARNAPLLYVDGVKTQTTVCNQPDISSLQPSDNATFYLGSSNALASIAEPTHPLLIDEVFVFESVLSDSDIKRLTLYPNTVRGASGFRWGAWGGQGSHASVVSKPTLPSFKVADLAFSSAGSYALLGEPFALEAATPAQQGQDLSSYDEVVLVADLPENQPFQFSLMAEHGKSQCTWHLFSSPQDKPNRKTYSQNVVIDLRRPSWCVDPMCAFDLTKVERAMIGSDWNSGPNDHEYSVRALAFRRRSGVPDSSHPKSTTLGGVAGPNGWCWRSVSYDPQWDVKSVQLTNTGVTFPQPTETLFLSENAPTREMPELAADPPPSDLIGARDLSQCASLELDVNWNAGSQTESDSSSGAVSNANERATPQFVLKDSRGYTAWFDLTAVDQPTLVMLDHATGVWGPAPEIDPRKEYPLIRQAVTRISLRSERAITINAVRCCDQNGNNCLPLQ